MALLWYSPSSLYVSAKLKCPKCNHFFDTGNIAIPPLNYSGEHAIDMENAETTTISCSNCDEEYVAKLWTRMSIGSVEIEPIPQENVLKNFEVQMFDNETIDENVSYYENFKDYMEKVKNAIAFLKGIKDCRQEMLFAQYLYVGVIASMEAYLSDTFILLTFRNEVNVRKFVENYEEFQKQKITLNEIYNQIEGLKNKIYNVLREIVWHRLDKVRCMYRKIYDIDLGCIEEINEAVAFRHDIVHRNGKNNEGKELNISYCSVLELIDRMDVFVQNIEKQVKQRNQ